MMLLPLLASLLLSFDGATDERIVARELDRLRGRGVAAEAAALVALLPEQSPLYRGRGPAEAARLRGYVFAALADVGTPAEAIPFVVAELAHEHRVYLLAAAARAAGAAGPAARQAVPHLLRILSPSFHDDQISLSEYNAAPPLRDPTTARLEAVRALGRIGARDALPVLRELAASSSSLQQEAQRAVWMIERPDRRAAGLRAADFVTPWLDPAQRSGAPLHGVTFVAHDGRTRGAAELAGKPLAVTFAYTRCDNPNKCPVTIAAMAGLQRALRRARLDDQVRLAVITLDPRHDDAVRLAAMARLQGLDLGDDVLMLRPGEEPLRRLEETLDVPVGHGAGQINNHGIALYLFDREGRFVRRHHSVVWDRDAVVADLGRLAREQR